MWRVVVPLARPALATVAIFTFLSTWNDFLLPLIYLNSSSKFTVALGLSQYVGEYGTTQMNLLMAATVLSVIPPIVLFIAAQRHFVGGIVTTGLRG